MELPEQIFSQFSIESIVKHKTQKRRIGKQEKHSLQP